jgi:F-type H+-transporting ATPase subunit epsilon
LIDDNYEHISRVLQEQLLSEEQNLKSMKDSLHRMEEEVLKRLWELDRGSI